MIGRLGRTTALLGALAVIPVAQAQTYRCENHLKTDIPPSVSPAPVPVPSAEPQPDPLEMRALKYAALATKYKLAGLASYYSRSLDGTLTATGEIFRNKHLTAAHLTLPLGTWIEVTARATGKKIRCRVNDRGPYVKKFVLDLSQAAARALGVDQAEDRYVDIHVIALPGEEPLPENWDLRAVSLPISTAAASAVTAQ
jgi:rare lipoprotein A (peptidoglycan hydrolase)